MNHTTNDYGKSVIAVGAPNSAARIECEWPKLLTDKAAITAMRDWIKDCPWGDMEESDIDELSDIEVIRGVANHYSGGVKEFLLAI